MFPRPAEAGPTIPFAGPGAVVKCDESKVNQKANRRLKQLQGSAYKELKGRLGKSLGWQYFA